MRRKALTLVVAMVIGALVSDPVVQVASAASPPTLGTSFCDGTATAAATVTCSSTVSASTSDVVIVFVTTSSGTPGTPSITGGGITFASRNTGSITGVTAAEFWGVPSAAISSQTVSDTVSGSAASIAIVVFTVTGADTSAPFDPSLATPPTAASAATGSPTITFSTTGTDDLLIGLAGTSASTGLTVGTCTPACTLIVAPSTTGQGGAAEYATTTTAGSQTLNFASTVSVTWVMFGDALVASGGAVPDLPFGVVPLLLLVPVVYVFMKTRTRAPVPRSPT